MTRKELTNELEQVIKAQGRDDITVHTYSEGIGAHERHFVEVSTNIDTLTFPVEKNIRPLIKKIRMYMR